MYTLMCTLFKVGKKTVPLRHFQLDDTDVLIVKHSNIPYLCVTLLTSIMYHVYFHYF